MCWRAVQVVVISRDITERLARQRLELELRDAATRGAKASRDAYRVINHTSKRVLSNAVNMCDILTEALEKLELPPDDDEEEAGDRRRDATAHGSHGAHGAHGGAHSVCGGRGGTRSASSPLASSPLASSPLASSPLAGSGRGSGPPSSARKSVHGIERRSDVRRLLATTRAECTTGLNLCCSALLQARSASGHYTPVMETISLPMLFSGLGWSDNARFVFEELPTQSVRTDPAALRAVLFNAGQNALLHGQSSGKVRVHASVTSTVEGGVPVPPPSMPPPGRAGATLCITLCNEAGTKHGKLLELLQACEHVRDRPTEPTRPEPPPPRTPTE